MKSFSEYMTLQEGAGNLKGIPKKFKDIITGKSRRLGDNNGMGGENSEIVLFKANAKQRDLTAATKKVGGFVKPSDRGNYRQTKQELQAIADKDGNAGVLVKINDEWAYLAQWTEYVEGGGNFALTSNEKSITVKRYNGSGRYRSSYESAYLKASELSDVIDFKEDKVDIYLVTADMQRALKREERKAARGETNGISKEKKAALIKFLEGKSDGVISEIKDNIDIQVNKINKVISNKVNKALKGEDVESIGSLDNIIDDLKKNLKYIDSMSYHIKSILKRGEIKDYTKEDSYNYRNFKELTKQIKDQLDK